MTVTLVLGGQRSGKSLHAENLLGGAARKVYIATAEAGDGEMAARIDAHRARRGDGWRTVEEPLDTDGDVAGETERLAQALTQAHMPVVLVSSEVGLGIVPDNALARAYADALGTLNQRIASVADRVVLVTAGLAQPLKG